MQNSVKCFAQVQVDVISCSSLSTEHCNSIIKSHHVCHAFDEAVLVTVKKNTGKNKGEEKEEIIVRNKKGNIAHGQNREENLMSNDYQTLLVYV